MFDGLRRRLIITYSVIFGLLILVIVITAYTLVWYKILDHERDLLIAQIYHEGEEYVDYGESPVNTSSIESGELLAYFVGSDGKSVILNQLSGSVPGDILINKQDYWPEENDTSEMIRFYDDDERRYRYLAAVAPVYDRNSQLIGRLYMFKNMDFYYEGAYDTFALLIAAAAVMFLGAAIISYWLSGRNIRPVKQMYEKQKQFTADASHEMRTPLTVLRLAVEGLETDSDSRYSSFAEETIGVIKEELQRMTGLTEELMELARRENTVLPLEKQALDITELCRSAVKQLQLIAEEKGSTVTSLPEQKLLVQGNAAALMKLLIILIENAVKYAGNNAVITVGAAENNKNIVLYVADNGPGISDEDKTKVFERFYRVDKARSRAHGGFGLGLSMALAIVNAHRGKIWIEDNKPHGTIVKVMLPK